MRRRRHPVLEEAAVAAIGLMLLAAFISTTYWLSTGESPWPGVVLGEAIAFTWGVILVAIASPSRHRDG
jgi:formate/nitrite transporter FocA (FNT family)